MVKGNLLSEDMSEFHAGSQKNPAGQISAPSSSSTHSPPSAGLFSKAGLRVAGTVNAGLILVCLG